MHLSNVRKALGSFESKTKIICPQAPVRKVNVLGKEASSWFNLKIPRNADNFVVPFDEAFSAKEVEDSFHK